MVEWLAPISNFVRQLATDYTTARAAKLDNLDAAISAISPIRSIQRGTILLANSVSSNTALITSVTVGKSFISHLGVISGNSSDLQSSNVRLTLTNGTTVTADRFGSTSAVTVGYEVVEFK